MSEPRRVLFVCMGNICRSPAAEGVFLQQLTQAGLNEQIEVDSAGTGGWHAGERADRRMRQAAEARGVSLLSRARQITAADLNDFDHILTMDEDNLRQVKILAEGRSHRARVEPLTTYSRRQGPSEVPDPYYGGSDGFEQVLDLLEDACAGLLESLQADLDHSKQRKGA
ncbi:low molecular weight protein-tyrosine-phosphatase [Cyanobium sp. Morenito 9A2]|uniref:low molecular weight protein-tyrosine-phosphatase n=1 Tax=Cyanobium sp. Morenito 9A2 TaxID=2823718 RepID=UPI0020CD8BD9|nr:low molecular weight protein-tyrosine-phosphatase [Cyanobium sp. Morenito 9A2]MCP9850582.1 low molecular weight phosphotyrosine protein phosphatase [Cyanobium sp. Morenito 9A2]